MDFEQMISDAFEKAVQKRGHVNILIAGRTGVGKSTLINSVFQGNFATTGQGRPVTEKTQEYTKDGIPLSILDSRGLELEDFESTLEELVTLIKSRSRETDPRKHVHVAWLCIAEDSRRVEDAESKLCKLLSDHMPVLAVVTKSRSDGGFRSEVQNLLPDATNVVRVRALKEQLDDGHVLEPEGLEVLIDATFQLVPEGQRRAFAAAQKVSTEMKKSASRKVVALSCTAAAGVAASPIPFSDAPLLVGVQTGMLAGISTTYGLDLSEAFLSTLVVASVGGAGAALVGKAIVANLLKLIPGAGTAAGALVSGTTAVAMTAALGEVYIATLDKLFVESGGEPPSADLVTATFKHTLALKSAK